MKSIEYLLVLVDIVKKDQISGCKSRIMKKIEEMK